MTDPRRQAWAPYIREVADRLRLRDWTIEVSDEGTDRPYTNALICVSHQRKYADLYLSDGFLDLTPERQRHCVVHELLHCHFGHADQWVRHKIDGDAEEAYTRMFEVGIDGLADAIAPLMPMPDVPGADTSGMASADEVRRLIYDRMHRVSDTPEESRTPSLDPDAVARPGGRGVGPRRAAAAVPQARRGVPRVSRQRHSPRLKAAAALELRRRKFRAFCAQFKDDPIGYARQVLGWEPTADQEEIAGLVVGNRRTCVKASHAIGKTGLAGVLANWWFDCFDESIVYITAPTWEQALGLTFKEVKRFRLAGCKARDPWERSDRMLWDGPLPGIVQETGNVKDEDKGRAMTHYIKAINAERAEGFQGEHSAPILIILEEAVGVGNHIWEGAEGLMTSPSCRWLAVANPTDEATDFGRATKRPTVKVHTVSVFQHPNIDLEMEARRPLIPLAVRLQWLRDMLADHCELADPGDPDAFEWWGLPAIDAALAGVAVSRQEAPARWWYKPNAVFEGRALGRFPGQAFEQVIPRKWLENLPVLEPPADELPEIGCDVARHGDDRTAIAVRHGPCLMSLRTIRQMDLNVVTSALRDAIAEAARGEGASYVPKMLDSMAANGRRNYDPKSLPVRIDVTGGLGAGPADTLKAEGYSVEFVNSSESSDVEDEAGNVLYPNVRSELWFACRERARKRDLDLSRVPADIRLQLIDELATPKWELTANGRKKVEDKKTTKKKLKWSPDLADAANLAFKAPAEPAVISAGRLEDFDRRWGT